MFTILNVLSTVCIVQHICSNDLILIFDLHLRTTTFGLNKTAPPPPVPPLSLRCVSRLYPRSLISWMTDESPGQHFIEDEVHALLHCPLYDTLKKRVPFIDLRNISNLSDLFMDSDKNHNKLMLVGDTIHNVLELNQYFTSYY